MRASISCSSRVSLKLNFFGACLSGSGGRVAFAGGASTDLRSDSSRSLAVKIGSVVAGIFADIAPGLEAENVLDRSVKKIAVVADDDKCSGEIVKIFFERDQRRDVEIVGRLIEQQYIRRTHQNSQQVKPPPLAARKISDDGILGGRREQKSFEHFARRYLHAVVRRDIFGDIADVVDDTLFVV